MFDILSIPNSTSEIDISSEYAPLPGHQDDNDTSSSASTSSEAAKARAYAVALTAQDKWKLVKPLLLKYMFPLCKPIYFDMKSVG